jgi:Zn-dependent protease with chaperone function
MQHYRIRLLGKALPGHTHESIAAALYQQMKLKPAQVQALLPPATVIVKAGLDAPQAERLQHLLARAGLASRREEHRVSATAPPAAAPSTATPARDAAARQPARQPIPPAPAEATATADPLDHLAEALGTRLGRRRPGPAYVAHLFLVTLCCLLVPMLYLALVAAFGYGLGWYLWHVHEFTGTHVHGFWPLFLLYIVPGASGGILLLFLARPMFAGNRRPGRHLQLEPDEEPRLVRAIETLARAIGIRPPVALQLSNEVNASVHFENGWAGFFSGRKVLTLGLPLAAGLSSRQLLGVLAHEFGHFAQRFGMRCSFLINHVNAWLYQRAHQPDPWDERLERWAAENDEAPIRLIVFCARTGIAGSRLLLAGLFQLSFRLSRSLSRQMEFDADRYEALLAGSECFGDTALRLRALARAFRETDQRNAASWREHKLLRDMPQAVAAQADGYDAATLAQLQRQLGSGITRYWDTHPADLERVRHAQSLQSPGLFHDERPATALFDRFSRHSEDATRAYYHALKLDFRHAELCDHQAVRALGRQRDDELDGLRRWTGRQWQPWPWLPLHTATEPALAALPWQACVGELRLHSPAITHDWTSAGQECRRRERLAFAGLLARHDFHFPLSRVEPFDEERHLPEYQRIVDWQTPSRLALQRVAGLYRQRMAHALGSDTLRNEPLLALASLYPAVESLREARTVAAQFDQKDVSHEPGLERIHLDARTACLEHALQLMRKCDDIPQPWFEGDSVGDYLRRRCPALRHAEAMAEDCVTNAGLLLDSLGHVWKLAFAAMAQRCAEAEQEHAIAGIDA